MLKKTITYKDFNGVERTEDFYFNLTQAETTEMEVGYEGGLAQMLQTIINAKDQVKLIETFKKFVLKAYGKKSPDGRRFIKTPEVVAEFAETEAYSKVFMELAFDSKAAGDFVNAVIPQHFDIPEAAQKKIAAANVNVAPLAVVPTETPAN